MPHKHSNDAVLSEEGSFLLRNIRIARKTFFIQVCWEVQLLLLSLALSPVLSIAGVRRGAQPEPSSAARKAQRWR